ncbi:TadE/TadG family type IV pilus assembly protein [Methylobacterium pseudosasicola]|uniref:Flp pilus assembly protein TadG n=1 Tax=Methylobacterium pseudosasicola TaxID=582667 RepID=A0A1I4HBZ8_9HYPH|nr:TadE/TadG family type IV pilus assembly protein [Methylobacterium pseudosasicola]SFL39734.1 Flp pilus assembly protein TadG [Methylobacterium pseudosasicola]
MWIGLQGESEIGRATTARASRTVRRSILRALHALPRHQGGASAVEFALVALPFLALSGAILEAGVTYFAQEILQQAVTDAGRQIYTGQFQTANTSITDTTTLLNNFRTAMCYPGGRARITVFPCANVRVSITKAASFGSATPVQATATNATTGISDWNTNFPSYTCARAGDVVVVQAAIDVPVYFPLLGAAYATLPNRRRLIQAATVFQVEPFNSTAACPSSS